MLPIASGVALLVLLGSLGCQRVGHHDSPSGVSALDDWQAFEHKIPHLRDCEVDDIVAQLVRKILDKETKNIQPAVLRRFLYADLVTLVNGRRAIHSEDLKSIFAKVVSVQGKPNPYMVRDMGYAPHEIFIPLGEFAAFVETGGQGEALDEFRHRTLYGYLARVNLDPQSVIDRGLRLSLTWKFPSVPWDRTAIRWFHLAELTHLPLERLHFREVESLPAKIKHLHRLRALLIQVQDRETLTKLGPILSSLKQVKALYLSKTVFWGQITLDHVPLLALENSPHITTFGFSSDVGFNHSMLREEIAWERIQTWAPHLKHIKTLVFVDGHHYRQGVFGQFDFTETWRKEHIKILKSIGQLKKFETLELLDLTGDTLAQLPPHDLRIDADQVRIRSHAFKDFYPKKPVPTVSLDTLKFVFSKTRWVILDHVHLKTDRVMQAENQWEELTLRQCYPVSPYFPAKNQYTLPLDPRKDQALKRISIEQSPQLQIPPDADHLFKIRRTPVLPLVLNWKHHLEQLEQDTLLFAKTMSLENQPKPAAK